MSRNRLSGICPELNSLLLPVIPLEPIQLTEDQQHMKKNELKHMLKEAATKLYETREAEFTERGTGTRDGARDPSESG